MEAVVPGTYKGAVPADPAHLDSDYGGEATLVLDGQRFDLSMIKHAPYSIEDGQQLVGTYTREGDQLRFVSEQFLSYTWETEKIETRKHTRMTFAGRIDAAGGIRIGIHLRGVWDVELELARWDS